MPLPTSEGHDAILVVVDRFTKMAHFLPTVTTVTAEGTARLILDNIVKLHGLPDDIISDRGAVFNSRLWELMCAQLGIERKLSSAYHPETDGQTERINQVMEQYIRTYCSYKQDNWTGLLSQAEFAYNNAESATTNMSPFAANYGFNPSMDFDNTWSDNDPNRTDLLVDIRQIQKYLRQEIDRAQERYKYFADQRRQPDPGYQSGDRVWLSTKHIKTTRPMKKLDYQYLGPYRIRRKIKDTAYELELPRTMRIHNVFHPSLLKTYHGVGPPRQVEPRTPPVVVQGDEFHEIEEILDYRKTGRSIQYLVGWKNYGVGDRTWEPASTLEQDAPELVSEFHRRNSGPSATQRHTQ